MSSDKYVGLDVHKATIVAAVHDAAGNCLMTSIIETKAETIRALIRGLTGTVLSKMYVTVRTEFILT